MAERQEMLPALNYLQLRIRTVHEQFNLPFCVRHTVHRIIGAMQPEHRTSNIRQSRMQAISFRKVDGRHTDSTPAIVALVVRLDRLAPIFAGVVVDIFAKADVDQEVAVLGSWFEVWSRFVGRPCLYVVFQ